MEDQLPAETLSGIGKADAYRTVRAWRLREKIPAGMSPERARETAAYWTAGDADVDIDGHDWVYERDTRTGFLLDILSAAEWKQWLLDEHAGALDDGRTGYQDLVLEPTLEPVTLVRKGHIMVRDGWHRCAAAVVCGAETLPTVIGSPKLELAPVP